MLLIFNYICTTTLKIIDYGMAFTSEERGRRICMGYTKRFHPYDEKWVVGAHVFC